MPEKLTVKQVAAPLQSAIDRLMEEIFAGLRHGHFRIAINCEVTNGGKRALVVDSGKTYRFLIAETELQK